MAYTSSPTTHRAVALDLTARERAAALVPTVRANYVAPPRRAYSGNPPPREEVDEAYVLTGATMIGLNRWTLPASPQPPAELFKPRGGVGVAFTPVNILDEDIARAEVLAASLGVATELILSCATASGLAMLAGDHAIHGPFEA